jgi:hypothetical protein
MAPDYLLVLNLRPGNPSFLAAELHARTTSDTQENLFNHSLNLGSAYQRIALGDT